MCTGEFLLECWDIAEDDQVRRGCGSELCGGGGGCEGGMVFRVKGKSTSAVDPRSLLGLCMSYSILRLV